MRNRLPETAWGPLATSRLYNRFHSLKSKARKKGQDFAWELFIDFVKDVDKVAPEGYSPMTHSIRFDPEIGYALRGMLFHCSGKQEPKEGTGVKGLPAKEQIEQIEQIQQVDQVALALEMQNLMNTRDLSIEEMISIARERAEWSNDSAGRTQPSEGTAT